MLGDGLMRRYILGLALAGMAICIAGPARADCRLPAAPSKVPDAATANQEEMVAAMQTLKHYGIDVTNYCKCLEFETSQNRLSVADQDRLRNLAIDGLKSITDKFNEQVRLFKSKG